MTATERKQNRGHLVIGLTIVAPPREKTSHRGHGLSIAGRNYERVVVVSPRETWLVGKERLDGDSSKFGSAFKERKFDENRQRHDVSPEG